MSATSTQTKVDAHFEHAKTCQRNPLECKSCVRFRNYVQSLPPVEGAELLSNPQRAPFKVRLCDVAVDKLIERTLHNVNKETNVQKPRARRDVDAGMYWLTKFKESSVKQKH